MGLVQVIIDRTTSMNIEGTYAFMRPEGGTLIAPSGASFPSVPSAGEWYWRTDQSVLYRRDDNNLNWVALQASLGGSFKSGITPPGLFSGNPKKATIVFASAYPNTSYSILFSPVSDGSRTVVASAENKTPSGFVLSLNTSNLANLIEVGWYTTILGG